MQLQFPWVAFSQIDFCLHTRCGFWTKEKLWFFYLSMCAFFFFFSLNPCHLVSMTLSILSSVQYIFFHTALLACKIILEVKLLSYLAGHLPVRIKSLYVISWYMSLTVKNIILLYFRFRWSDCTTFKNFQDNLFLSSSLWFASKSLPHHLSHWLMLLKCWVPFYSQVEFLEKRESDCFPMILLLLVFIF